MDVQQSQTETSAAPTSASTCRKRESKSDSFLTNAMDHFHEFIDRPMEEHKACFKLTYQKIIEKFSIPTPAPKEGGDSAPVETTVKN